jgi:hypothetical protein
MHSRYCRGANVSDARSISAPVGHGLLDIFAAQVFRERALNQRRQFSITGETQADQLRVRKLADPRTEGLLQDSSKPYALFQANDPVLHLERKNAIAVTIHQPLAHVGTLKV